MTSWLRRLLVLTVVVAGSALLALALLHTAPARPYLLGWAKEQARARFGIALEADRLDYNLFTLSFRLSRVRLSKVRPSTVRLQPDPATGTGSVRLQADPVRIDPVRLQADPAIPPPFFEADEVAVDLPWSVIRGPLAIESLRLARPRVTIVRGADGALNLPASRVAGAPLERLPIGRLTISDAAVTYTDAPRAFSLAVAALEATLVAEQGTVIGGAFAATGGLRLDWDSARVVASRLDGRVRYDGSAVLIEPLRLRTPEGDLEARGRIDVFRADPQIDVAYRAVADVGRVVTRWPAVGPLPGSLGITGRVSGRLGDPALTVEFAGGVAGGTVIGTGRLAAEADHTDPVIAVDYVDLDLRQVLRAARWTPPFRISGRLAGRGELTWHGTGRDGFRVALENDTRPAGARDALGVSGRATLRIERGAWSLTHAHRLGRTLEVSGDAHGRVDAAEPGRSSLEGAVRLQAHDVAAMLNDLALAGLAVQPMVDTGLDGGAEADLTLSGTIATPGASGRLDVERFRIASSDPLRLISLLDLDLTRLQVGSLELTGGSNRVTASGRLEFRTRALDVTVRGDVLAIDGPLRALPERWRPAGALAFNGHIGGTLDEPRIDVSASGRELHWAGQTFDGLNADLRLIGETLLIERAALTQRGGDGRLSAEGRYHFGTRAYAVKARGSNLAIGPVPPAEPGAEAWPLAARADVEFDGEGSLDRPAGRGLVTFAALAWDRFEVGPAQALIAIEGGAARITARAAGLGLTTEGRVAIAAPHRFALSAAVTDGDLARWSGSSASRMGPLSGTMSWRLEASGRLDDVAAADAELALDRAEAHVTGGTIQLAEPARLRYAGGQLAASGLAIRAGGTTLTLTGLLAGGAASTLSLALDGDLQDLTPFARGLLGQDVDARGPLRVTITATGGTERPVVVGDMTLRDATVKLAALPPATSLALNASLVDGMLNVTTLTGAWQDASVSASGRVPASFFARWLPPAYVSSLPAGDRAARLTARITPITKAVLAPWVAPATLAQIDLGASATLTLEADDVDLTRLRGQLVFDQFELGVAQVPIRQVRPTRLTLERGRVLFEDVSLTGGDNGLTVTGEVAIAGDRTVDMRVQGGADLRLLSALFRDVATGGRASIDVRVTGSLPAPTVEGQVDISSGELRVREPRVVVTDASGRLVVRGGRLEVVDGRAVVNGGPATIGGTLTLDGITIRSGTLTASGRTLALELMPGLRTEADAELRLTFDDPGPRLSGKVVVTRGAYRHSLTITGQVLQALAAGRRPSGEVRDQTWLDRLRLDLAVITSDDVTVDNNYGQMAIAADLRVGGTVGRPALGGRLTGREGGRLYLGGTTYRLDRATIDFVDPAAIKPDLNLTAIARVSTYDITLKANGTPDALNAALTSSDPTLSQSDIVSLLVTGRRASEVGSASFGISQNQVLALLSGDLLAVAGRTFGLDAVRVEGGSGEDLFGADPALLASETKTTQRLSVTKNLSRQVDIVLSQNLSEQGGLTWIALYRPTASLEIRGVSRDDASQAIQLAQRLRFGGPPSVASTAASRQPEPRIAAVRITGNHGSSEAALLERLSLREGQRFDFYRWQEDRDRLERLYHERGYLEARIVARRQQAGGADTAVTLEYDIDRGPGTRLIVSGHALDDRVMRALAEIWSRAVFDGFLVEDARVEVLTALARDGYLRARVTADVRRSTVDGAAQKDLVVTVEAGPRSAERRLAFEGVSHWSTEQLQTMVAARGLALTAWLDAAAFERSLVALYREDGLLAATATVGAARFDETIATLPVTIDEGPAFLVEEIQVDGARAQTADDLRQALGLDPGSPYRPAALDEARRRVVARYRARGFNQARAELTATLHPERARVTLVLTITEGAREVLGDVAVEGARLTHPDLIERLVKARPGEPVVLDDWYQARKRLYETGVFRAADIEFEPAGNPIQRPNAADQPVAARVVLDEWPPYQVRYGLQLDKPPSPAGETENPTFGVTGELQRRNLFGQAITAGLVGRYEANLWLGRVFASSPTLIGRPLKTSVYLTRSHEDVQTTATSGFVTNRWILSMEQEVLAREQTRIAVGYGFERNHLQDDPFDPDNPFALDVTLSVARLTSSFTHDTRSSPFQPSRGWFQALTGEYSAPGLGSDLRFFKLLLQDYYFHPLGPVVLASAGRFGAIAGPNSIVSELFFTGGGTTVRGYRQDSLGPPDVFGGPAGGRAMLVLNQEARVSVWRWLGAVAFIDAGNVFSEARDLRLGDLKVGVGLGARIDTPFALVRVDFGVPVPRPSGSPFGRWYFSLGHIF